MCNTAAMEGLAIQDYPLVRQEAEWPAILTAPDGREWTSAARIGHAFVRDHCSAEGFEQSWQEIMQPLAREPILGTAEPAPLGFPVPGTTDGGLARQHG